MTEVVDSAETGNKFLSYHYFQVPVYTLETPEFLEVLREISAEYLDKAESDPEWPVKMTENMFNDPRLEGITNYIKQCAWNILHEQGYAMEHFEMGFNDMWCQEHLKTSSMDQHTHGSGSQISGFYFLDCPENCSNLLIYDPKAGKVQCGLPVRDDVVVGVANDIISIIPEEGTFLFTNSWLPHSFTRHRSDKPLRFIHINLYATPKMPFTVEVV